jgi:predicted outer membrane repeat protein
MRESVRRRLSDRGSIAVIVIAAVAIASMIVGSYLLFIDDHRERTAREGDDTAAQIRLEQNILRIQSEIQLTAKTEGKIDLPQINSYLRTLADSVPSAQWLKLTLNGYNGGVAPIDALADPLSSLTSLQNQGDPFLGARAQVLGVEAESSASTLVGAQSRLSSKKVVVTPQIDVRVIPASQFTVFTLGTGLDVNQTNFTGSIGRIFALGDIQFSGNFSTNYPIVSGGNLYTTGLLTISLDPNSPIQFSGGQIAYAQPNDSSEAAWLAESRTQYNSAIINPGSLPVSLSLPPVADGTVSGPVGNQGSGMDLATVRDRCDLLLFVQPDGRGGYGITEIRGEPGWLHSDGLLDKPNSGSGSPSSEVGGRSGKRRSRQSSPFVAGKIRITGTSEQVVVAFNYGALGQKALQQIHAVYFEFDQSIADAAVLVRAGQSLQSNITIASRWPVLVAGDFNAGQNPALASILTAQTVISVDSNWGNSVFGFAP